VKPQCETAMTATAYIQINGLKRSLKDCAQIVFHHLGVDAPKYIFKPLANQDYDFWWEGTATGVRYELRGDRWEEEEQQAYVTICIAEKHVATTLAALRLFVAKHGYTLAIRDGNEWISVD
jgi:hypothetical protein